MTRKKNTKKGAAKKPSFFIRQKVKGKTRYRDSKGRFVSIEKVEKSHKRVIDYYKRGKALKPKEAPETVVKDDIIEGEAFETHIFGQQAARVLSDDLSNGRRFGIKYKGVIKEVQSRDSFAASMYLTELEAAYISAFSQLTDSPQLMIGYIEGKSASILDIDSLDLMDEEAKESGEDEFNAAARSFNVKKGLIYKKYFK